MNQSDSNLCISIINKDLSLGEDESLPEITDSDGDELLEKNLTRLIQYLLDKDFNRLINAMYRIDIPENEFKLILETSDPDVLAKTLARRIISRAYQKLEIRKKYSS